MAADEAYLVNLVRLQSAPEFIKVVDKMKADLADADRNNRRLSGDSLHRSQGRAIYIEEFLTRLETARTTVEKIRSR